MQKVDSLDRWQQALQELKTKLQTCQTEHGLHSCTPCPQLLSCELREHYVKAVYESMSKDKSGGFEF